MDVQSIRTIAAAACMVGAAIGPGVAIGFLGHVHAALGRNPEARGQ